MATAISHSPSPFVVFRRRNFALMWTGQLVSTSGRALTSLVGLVAGIGDGKGACRLLSTMTAGGYFGDIAA